MMINFYLRFAVCFFTLSVCNSALVFAQCGTADKIQSLGLLFNSQQKHQTNSTDPYNFNFRTSRLLWNSTRFHYSHEYTVINFPDPYPNPPTTNGHLHEIKTGYRDSQPINTTNKIQYAVIPTLAVSSNQLKNPEALNLSSFRLDGYVSWHYLLATDYSIKLGGCLSALSGEYELLPVIALGFRNNLWGVSLGYPQSEIEYKFTPKLDLFSDWSLAGREWQTLDRQLTHRSKFMYNAEQLRVGFRYRIETSQFEIYHQKLIKQNINYLSTNLSRSAVRLGGSNAIVLQFSLLL